GFMILIANSDPSMRTVAPAGAREAQLAPNPLAFGYPTEDEPILIDISTSSVANGWVRRWSAEGRRLPGKWLLDAVGNPTDDRELRPCACPATQPTRAGRRNSPAGSNCTPPSYRVCKRGLTSSALPCHPRAHLRAGNAKRTNVI